MLNQTESNVTNAEINTYKAVDELQTVRVAPLAPFIAPLTTRVVGRRISAKLEDKNTYSCCMLSCRASCSGWRRGWIFGLRVHEINPSPITTILSLRLLWGGGGEGRQSEAGVKICLSVVTTANMTFPTYCQRCLHRLFETQPNGLAGPRTMAPLSAFQCTSFPKNEELLC